MAETFSVSGTPKHCPICMRRGSLRLLRRKPEVYECGSDTVRGDGCFALFRFGPVREGFPDVLTRIPALAMQALTDAERRVVRGGAA